MADDTACLQPVEVFDFGQQRQKRGELHGNLGSSDSGCLSKSQRFGVAGILNRLAQRHFTRGCGNLDAPFKYRALHSRVNKALQQHDVEGDPFFAVWKMDEQWATHRDLRNIFRESGSKKALSIF